MGSGGAYTVKERSTGGPAIQDPHTACASTGPFMRRHSTPPPLPSPAKKHNTPKGQNTHPSGSVASLLAQFQQSQHSRSQNVSPKSMLTKDTLVKDISTKDTPKKDTPKKGEQTPAKKLLTPDKSTELPVKNNGPAPPAVIEGVKLTTTRQTKARRRRKGRRKSLRASPPWLLTRRQRKLKSSRKNASG